MKRYVLGFFTSAILGTGLHFLFILCPLPLFGVIAPISESVWEHLKLLLWPVLPGAWVVGRRDLSFWGNVCLTVLAMPPMLVGACYALLCGFGILSPVVEIGLYYLTLAGGFALLYHMRNAARSERQVGIFLMLCAIWACILFIFSMYPPDLGIFRP